MTIDLPVLNGSAITSDVVSYSYSYPHKSSYDLMTPSIRLNELWRTEDQRRLMLYAHIPFCEMRCGFCNLFTQSQPHQSVIDDYMIALSRQMKVVRSELPRARFAVFAVGGGTPTFLSTTQLETFLTQVEDRFDLSLAEVPTSIETSPATTTIDRLKVLSGFGFERISVGIQSFASADIRTFGRPQSASDATRALDLIREFGFPQLNVDLIYGSESQTCDNWMLSLKQALQYQPEELYLYPLYVRPETGLAGRCNAAGLRLDLYRLARDRLLSDGYEQVSMRCFRKNDVHFRESKYSCACDGTVGLGCGARSYTARIHYGTRFGVTQTDVRTIVSNWIRQSDDDFRCATYGIKLDSNEQRRRFAIMNLLQSAGLSLTEYQIRFERNALDDLPNLATLVDIGWVDGQCDVLRLTELGFENSDTIGPLLYSDSVRERLREFTQL